MREFARYQIRFSKRSQERLDPPQPPPQQSQDWAVTRQHHASDRPILFKPSKLKRFFKRFLALGFLLSGRGSAGPRDTTWPDTGGVPRLLVGFSEKSGRGAYLHDVEGQGGLGEVRVGVMFFPLCFPSALLRVSYALPIFVSFPSLRGGGGAELGTSKLLSVPPPTSSCLPLQQPALSSRSLKQPLHIFCKRVFSAIHPAALSCFPASWSAIYPCPLNQHS